MKQLDINQFKQGIPGITTAFGSFLWEAAVFCLEKMGHQSGVILQITGHQETNLALKWEGNINDDAAKTWSDELDLVEYAATSIAILLALELTEYTHLQRAQKGTGGDYWLGKEDSEGVVVLDGLLEVSGILKENKNNRISKRFNLKKIQVNTSPYLSVAKNIIVVEFGTPKSKIELI